MAQYLVTMDLPEAEPDGPLPSIEGLVGTIRETVLPSLEALIALKARGRVLAGEVGIRGQREVLLDRLPGLQTPTLVVWGERDRVLPASQAHEAAARLPNGSLERYPTAGTCPKSNTPIGSPPSLVGSWVSMPDPRSQQAGINPKGRAKQAVGSLSGDKGKGAGPVEPSWAPRRRTGGAAGIAANRWWWGASTADGPPAAWGAGGSGRCARVRCGRWRRCETSRGVPPKNRLRECQTPRGPGPEGPPWRGP
jgi:hypothetical protein